MFFERRAMGGSNPLWQQLRADPVTRQQRRKQRKHAERETGGAEKAHVIIEISECPTAHALRQRGVAHEQSEKRGENEWNEGLRRW